MVKFLHFSDTHIPGYKTPTEFRKIREEESIKKFNFVIDKAIEENVDFVIHSGDLFDSSSVSNQVLIEVAKALDKLRRENIPFYAIKGNHDVMGISAPCFDILLASGLLIEPTIEKEGEKVKFHKQKDSVIIGLSEPRRFSDERLKEYYKNSFVYLRKILDNCLDEGSFNILMLHLTFKKAIRYTKYDDVRAIERSLLEQLPKIRYYALAHEHCPPKRVYEENGIYYVIPGSLEKYFKEEDIKDQKRVIIYDDGNIKEIPVPHREMKLIKNDDFDEDAFNDLIKELSNVAKEALVLLRLRMKDEKLLLRTMAEVDKISRLRGLNLAKEISLVRTLVVDENKTKVERSSIEEIISEFVEGLDPELRDKVSKILFERDHKRAIEEIFGDKDWWW